MIAENIKNATCPNCTKVFCATCMKNPHQGDCNLDEAIQQARAAGLQLKQCPNCRVAVAKDEKCNHVTCYSCKVEWMFCCSSLREPIMKHSAFYHRKQCKDYSRVDSELAYSEECVACKARGSLCDPPQESMWDFRP